jgi:hypothetical protein
MTNLTEFPLQRVIKKRLMYNRSFTSPVSIYRKTNTKPLEKDLICKFKSPLQKERAG